MPTLAPTEIARLMIEDVYASKQLYAPPLGIGEDIAATLHKTIEEQGPIQDLDGREIAFRGQRTALILGIAGCPPCEEQLPLIQQWAAELTGLQLVYAARGKTTDQLLQPLRGMGKVRLIDDGNKRLAATLQARVGPTTFLIDEAGIIRWRMTGFLPWHGGELDRVVRQFAAGQVIETYYWESNFDQPGKLPSLPLTDETQQPVDLPRVLVGHFSLLLFLQSRCAECREIAPAVLDLAEARRAEGLQVVLVLDSFSEEERRRAADYLSSHQMDEQAAALFNQPHDPSDDLHYLVELKRSYAVAIRALLDPESRLSTFWTIGGAPFALFIDREGQVRDFLPFFRFALTETEPPSVAPTLAVLEKLLDDLLK